MIWPTNLPSSGTRSRRGPQYRRLTRSRSAETLGPTSIAIEVLRSSAQCVNCRAIWVPEAQARPSNCNSRCGLTFFEQSQEIPQAQ